MRKIFVSILLLFLFLFLTNETNAQQVKALHILSQYYGLNYYLDMEMFESFGWEVTLAGVTPTVAPCPWATGHPARTVDVLISEITDVTQYDCIIIASQNWRYNNQTAYSDLLDNQDALDLISAANDSGLVIWATCAGARVLAAANVINGVKVQGQAGTGNLYVNEITAAGGIYMGSQLPPVIDGNIVTTTRGQYYMIQNCEAIMTALENTQSKRSKRKAK